jgi:hypothetical protein
LKPVLLNSIKSPGNRPRMSVPRYVRFKGTQTTYLKGVKVLSTAGNVWTCDNQYVYPIQIFINRWSAHTMAVCKFKVNIKSCISSQLEKLPLYNHLHFRFSTPFDNMAEARLVTSERLCSHFVYERDMIYEDLVNICKLCDFLCKSQKRRWLQCKAF